MNFNNFSVSAMLMKFYGVSSYPMAAKKIWFLLFDIFQCQLLIMQKSVFLACEFCVGSFFE
jgi:hypothetical protein